MEKNKKILLATSNKGKLKEFNDIFNNYELISQSELNIEDAIEDGLTFFENALIKARHGSRNSGLFSIALSFCIIIISLFSLAVTLLTTLLGWVIRTSILPFVSSFVKSRLEPFLADCHYCHDPNI